MSQNDTLHLTQEFLGRMGSGAEAAEIAKLFSENMEWEIAGDTGVLPWIGQKSGRAAVTDFVNDSRAMIERPVRNAHSVPTFIGPKDPEYTPRAFTARSLCSSETVG